MADNRMYLKCKICDKKIFIAKLFNGWYLPSYKLNETIDNELSQHNICISDLNGEIFELIYENDEK